MIIIIQWLLLNADYTTSVRWLYIVVVHYQLCQFYTQLLHFVQGNETKSYLVNGSFILYGEVSCELPVSTVLLLGGQEPYSTIQTMNISLTNDGQMFSNSLTLIVYDSKCKMCNSSTGDCDQRVSCFRLYLTFPSNISITFAVAFNPNHLIQRDNPDFLDPSIVISLKLRNTIYSLYVWYTGG